MCAPRALKPCAQAQVCQLSRDLAVPCHDTTSMSRPKLSRDLEYQVTTWEPPSLSKSVATENSLLRQNSLIARSPLSCAPKAYRVSLAWSVTRAWPPMSRHNTAPHCRVCEPLYAQPCRVRQSFLSWPTLSWAKEHLCLGQLCRDLGVLCRDKISPYFPANSVVTQKCYVAT